MDDELPVRLARVAAKLRTAAALPAKPAEAHRFRIGPPLAEETVAAFEERHRVRLPADYRGFITTVGNGGPGAFGGAGPFYGLLGLDDRGMALLEVPDATTLATPFPAEPGKASVNWLAEVAPGDDDEPYRGTLTLSHQGCGDFSLLIVSGPHRGRVAGTSPGVPAPRFAPDPGFLAWYERWLDTVLAGTHFVSEPVRDA